MRSKFAVMFIAAAAVAVAAGAPGCESNSPRARVSSDSDRQPATLFEGMGSQSRKVTTSSPEAQAFFNQGLVWTYAFNHDEAIRSFTEAARLDPDCAMAWLGIAFCHGPHINNPAMSETAVREAWSAMRRAQSLRATCTPAERALIDAVAARYSEDPGADRAALNQAFADAMERAHRAHPNDADIATLFADSLMNLQPWDLYDNKTGAPKGRAEKIVAVLEHALRLDLDHIGAHHLYIHAVEASPAPERGLRSADALRAAVPMSSHLLHMPSHIDVQVGNWPAAAVANRRAAAADEAYEAISPDQGFYRVYMAHNDHFLAFVSMMQGRRDEAIAAARAMIAGVPGVYIKEQGPFIDPYMSIDTAVMMRFGMWDELLRSPQPPKELPITRAMWRFTRGVALAAKGDISRAEREREAFEAAVAKVPADALMAINPASMVLDIARHVLDGEIAYRRGDIDTAVAELNRAIEIEDDLLYMEPPEWIQPVRHTLGAILVEAGRHSEAEASYRKDLENWPNNGWSLLGLAQCLEARGDLAESNEARRRFNEAWATADTPIETTCLCVTPKE